VTSTSLTQIVETRRVVVCAGSGGVGKTTTAAVLAIEAARRGRRAVVVTIDPAKRLADTLGIGELTNAPKKIDGDWSGEVWALMLDTKSTFDDLIATYAGDADQAARILQNPFYRNISGALSGTQEYMAGEKLYELHEESDFDLVVVDTPPTRNALDFLDAPRKLSEFIDSRSLSLLTAPGRLGLRVLGRGTGVAFSVMQRATGIDLLRDLGDFFRAFGDMTAGFRERAARVNELLGQRTTAFVLVTSPRREAIDEGIYFHRRLKDAGLPFSGVIANRVAQAGGRARRTALVGELGEELAAKVLEAHDASRRLAERDQANLELLRRRLGRTPMLEVPHLDEEVHDLAGLARMDEYLF
jgi:anion-transporting  ArsA/GET3 family ATPase